MSVDDIKMSELSIEVEEEVETIYVSLMSKMCSEYDAIIAMELDFEVESVEEPLSEHEEAEELNTTENTKTAVLKKKEIKSKKVYRDYSDTQIEAVLDMLNNGISTTAAAKQLGITKSSTYRFREKLFAPLKQEHTDFTVKYIDTFATATVEYIKDEPMQEFATLSVSQSAVQRHMKANCVLSMKRLEKFQPNEMPRRQ